MAVGLDDMAAKALRANNVAREVINTAVGDAAWWEGEPWSVTMASPPCPCFNTLKGSPGLGHPSAEAWYEFFSFVRSTQPSYILIENVTGAIQKLSQKRHAMYLCGFKPLTSRTIDLKDTRSLDYGSHGGRTGCNYWVSDFGFRAFRGH